jgi:hypothetical protein
LLTGGRVEQGMSKEDAEIAADATINKIVGARIPQDFVNVFTVKVPGSSKSRTLNLPDSMMREYLESDANYVLQRHIRERPRYRTTRTFGDRTMEKQLKDIQDEYDELMRKPGRPGEAGKSKRKRYPGYHCYA